jgi:hypothetical protein
VGVAGSLEAAAAVVGPGEDVLGGVLDGQDEDGEQSPDLVDGQRGQAVLVTVVGCLPMTFSVARVMVRNAAAAMARVMWAYQAS